MSYVSSKNLVTEPEFVELVSVGFVLSCNKEVGIKRRFYCCPFCKKLYNTNPFQKLQTQVNTLTHQCKYCNTLLSLQYVKGDFAYYFRKKIQVFLYQFQTIQTIVIGEQYDENDDLVAVNKTIFYRKHVISVTYDDIKQKYVRTYSSYMQMYRTIMNLEQNQIYFVQKPGDKTGTFSHFDIKYCELFTTDVNNIDFILHRKMIDIIYEKKYGLALPHFVASQPAITLYMAFYLMKFPVVSSYAFSNKSICITSNMFCLFYWLSNADRKLRKLITCRSTDEYHLLWCEYLEKTFDVSESDAMSIIHDKTPWFLLTAWQMGHMGFCSLDNVAKIEEYVVSTGLDSGMYTVPIILILLFMKRFHAMNKFFRRLIKSHGEDEVVSMILLSKFQTNYWDFIFHYRQKITKGLSEMDFQNEDFSNLLDVFVAKWVLGS